MLLATSPARPDTAAATPRAWPVAAAVRARAPLRLGLAGGGTDVSPYCDLHGGAVMNATIDRYIYVTIEAPAGGDEVVLESHDLGVETRYRAGRGELPVDGRLDLPKAVYNRVVRDFLGGQAPPLRIATHSEAPAGSGLGSSSTLAVAVLQGLTEMFGLPLGEYDVAHLAYAVERQDLGLAGGRQDQYAAAFGGFNFMEFRADDVVVVNPLRIKPEMVRELDAATVLCFTGVSRESATIIAEQVRHAAAGDAKPIEAMHRLKAAAVAMKEALLRGDRRAVAATLHQGWESKRDMASGISTGPIEDAMATAMAAGALAGKVSGAGGGGFVMLLAPLERRRAVMDALHARGYRAETCRFTNEGAVTWRI